MKLCAIKAGLLVALTAGSEELPDPSETSAPSDFCKAERRSPSDLRLRERRVSAVDPREFALEIDIIGNQLRRRGFPNRRALVVVAEGDSWLRGPSNGLAHVIERELRLPHRTTPILNLANAGDHIGTLEPPDCWDRGQDQSMSSNEQMRILRGALGTLQNVDALLLSGGGNDLVAHACSYIQSHKLDDSIEKVVDEMRLDAVLKSIQGGY